MPYGLGYGPGITAALPAIEFATAVEVEGTVIPSSVDIVRTFGRGESLDGGGATYLRTLSTVRGGLTDQSAAKFRPDLSSPINPITFGAKGGDVAFDDSAGIQNMIEAIMEFGRGVGVLGMGRSYYCGDGAPLALDPRAVRVVGWGSTLDFRLKTFSNPAAATELLSNPSFTSDTVWLDLPTNTAGAEWTIAGGVATYATDVADKYAGIYQAVTGLIPGRRYKLEFTVDSIGGGTSQNYALASMRTTGPDAGATYGRQAYAPGTYSYEFTWPTSAPTTGYFSLKGQSFGIVVSSVSLKLLPQNACLTIDGGIAPVAGQYGHSTQAIEGVRLIGGGSGTGALLYGDAILGMTRAVAQSSRFTTRDLYIQGFARGVALMDRSYLMNIDQTDIASCNIGLEFVGGADSGENLKLMQTNIYNSGIGVINNGGYMHLAQCSIDYTASEFIVMSGGYTHATQCHFEKNSPSSAEAHVMHVKSGTLILEQGYMQLNVSGSPAVEHPFQVDLGGRLLVHDMQAFGLLSAVEEVVGGEGYVDPRSRFSGIGQKTMSPFWSRAERFGLITPSSVNSAGDLLWTCLAEFGTRVSQWETSTVKVEPLTAGERTSGQKGVKITKLAGAGTAGRVALLVPVPADGMASSEWYVKVPPHASSTATVQIYVDIFESDVDMRPAAAPLSRRNLVWQGEKTTLQNLDLAVGLDWTRILYNATQRTNPLATEFGMAARTHVRLLINATQAPAGTEIHICDPQVQVL